MCVDGVGDAYMRVRPFLRPRLLLNKVLIRALWQVRPPMAYVFDIDRPGVAVPGGHLLVVVVVVRADVLYEVLLLVQDVIQLDNLCVVGAELLML